MTPLNPDIAAHLMNQNMTTGEAARYIYREGGYTKGETARHLSELCTRLGVRMSESTARAVVSQALKTNKK